MSDDDWETITNETAKVGVSKKPAVKDSWDGEDEESEEEEAPPPAKSAAAPKPGAPGAATENGSVKIAAAENSIDRLNPVTLPEFETLRNNVESKLAPLAASPYYNTFVEELIRELCTGA